MAAFLESVQLQRQAAELLPLAADGKTAALPEGAEHTRRLLLAILLQACIHYLCPEPVPIVQHFGIHLEAYMPAGLDAEHMTLAGGGSSSGGGGASLPHSASDSTDLLECALVVYAAAGCACGWSGSGAAALASTTCTAMPWRGSGPCNLRMVQPG